MGQTNSKPPGILTPATASAQPNYGSTDTRTAASKPHELEELSLVLQSKSIAAKALIQQLEIAEAEGDSGTEEALKADISGLHESLSTVKTLIRKEHSPSSHKERNETYQRLLSMLASLELELEKPFCAERQELSNHRLALKKALKELPILQTVRDYQLTIRYLVIAIHTRLTPENQAKIRAANWFKKGLPLLSTHTPNRILQETQLKRLKQTLYTERVLLYKAIQTTGHSSQFLTQASHRLNTGITLLTQALQAYTDHAQSRAGQKMIDFALADITDEHTIVSSVYFLA